GDEAGRAGQGKERRVVQGLEVEEDGCSFGMPVTDANDAIEDDLQGPWLQEPQAGGEQEDRQTRQDGKGGSSEIGPQPAKNAPQAREGLVQRLGTLHGHRSGRSTKQSAPVPADRGRAARSSRRSHTSSSAAAVARRSGNRVLSPRSRASVSVA